MDRTQKYLNNMRFNNILVINMIFVPKKRAKKAIRRMIEENKKEVEKELLELRKEYMNSED